MLTNGKKFECAAKGYLPRKRGKQGYQISAAFCSNTGETVTMHLDPGNTNSIKGPKDIQEDISIKYSAVITNKHLILRADSDYGSDDGVKKLIATRAKFVVKDCFLERAKNLAIKVSRDDCEELNECVDVYELLPEDNLRITLVRILGKDGVKYTYIATNIPASEMSTKDPFHFYSGIKTIETFIYMEL